MTSHESHISIRHLTRAIGRADAAAVHEIVMGSPSLATEPNLAEVLSHVRDGSSQVCSCAAYVAELLLRLSPELGVDPKYGLDIIRAMGGFAVALAERYHASCELTNMITLGASVERGMMAEHNWQEPSPDPRRCAEWLHGRARGGLLRLCVGYGPGLYSPLAERPRFLSCLVFAATKDFAGFVEVPFPSRHYADRGAGFRRRETPVDPDEPGQTAGRGIDYVLWLPPSIVEDQEALFRWIGQFQALQLGMLVASIEEHYAVFFPGRSPHFFDARLRAVAAAYRTVEKEFVTLLRRYDSHLDGLRRVLRKYAGECDFARVFALLNDLGTEYGRDEKNESIISYVKALSRLLEDYSRGATRADRMAYLDARHRQYSQIGEDASAAMVAKLTEKAKAAPELWIPDVNDVIQCLNIIYAFDSAAVEYESRLTFIKEHHVDEALYPGMQWSSFTYDGAELVQYLRAIETIMLCQDASGIVNEATGGQYTVGMMFMLDARALFEAGAERIREACTIQRDVAWDPLVAEESAGSRRYVRRMSRTLSSGEVAVDELPAPGVFVRACRYHGLDVDGVLPGPRSMGKPKRVPASPEEPPKSVATASGRAVTR